MAFTQADLDNISRNIASGILETRYADGRLVRFQTLDEMVRARALIAGQVTSNQADSRPRRRTAPYRNGC